MKKGSIQWAIKNIDKSVAWYEWAPELRLIIIAGVLMVKNINDGTIVEFPPMNSYFTDNKWVIVC